MSTEFKSFFKSVTGNEGSRCHYNTRLDTYGCGCQHNCMYCYAKSLLDFRKLWNPAYPSVANINKIRGTIRRKLKKGDIVRLGGMTDCFMPLEKEQRITLETIKYLNELGIGYLIVTKSALIADPEYVEVMDNSLAHIQISLTSTDDELSKKIEPGASLPSERICAIEKLQELGFDVSVRLSPFIPQFYDFDIINSIKCDKVLIEFLRVNTWIKKWLSNVGCNVDLSEYTKFSSGYSHLPLVKKLEYIEKITGFKEHSVCEDVEDHWEYWKDNYNHNSEDCCNLKTSE